MCVHPLQVVVLLCILPYSTVERTVVEYLYFKPGMSRSKQKNSNDAQYYTFQDIPFTSVAQQCLTLCDPMNCSTPVLLPGKSMDKGAWQAAVHEVAKSRTRLSDFTFTFHFHVLEMEMATHSSILAWESHRQRILLQAAIHGVSRVGHDLVTKQQQQEGECWSFILGFLPSYRKQILTGTLERQFKSWTAALKICAVLALKWTQEGKCNPQVPPQ